MLVENENLTRAASLGNRMSQLEEIVDLTTQQIAALSNLARVHDLLAQQRGSVKGVMQLSQNIAFVQLQLRLEKRVKDFEELLRRVRRVKSCVRHPTLR